MNTQTQNNKEIALLLSKSIMNGDWAKVEELLADDFQYIGDGRPAIDKQGYIYFMKELLCTAMTDTKMTFTRVVGEGGTVVVDYENDMLNSGSYMGIPATNKRVLGTDQFMRKVVDGKVVAEWQTTNNYGLMQQLGVIPMQG